MSPEFADYDFWLSLIELGKQVYRIPEVLFFYRQHSRSMMSKFITQNQLVSAYCQVFKNHSKLYCENISAIFEQIISLRTQLALKQGPLEWLSAQVTEKDTHIANLEQALAAKDTHIANLDGIRRQLQETLEANSTHIASLEQALAEQQAHLRTLEAEHEGAVQALHGQLAETEQRLHALEGSLGWKLQTRVRQIRMRFTPPASRRERAWRLGIRFLRAWLDRGFLAAVRERVTRLRRPGGGVID